MLPLHCVAHLQLLSSALAPKQQTSISVQATSISSHTLEVMKSLLTSSFLTVSLK
jgi:hypothetical protein